MNHITHKIALLFIPFIFVGCAQTSQQTQNPAPVEITNPHTISASDLGTANLVARHFYHKNIGSKTQLDGNVSYGTISVDLYRASNTPIDIAKIYYPGEANKGRITNSKMLADGRISFSVLNEKNKNIPFVRSGHKYVVKGKVGERYKLFYRNYTNNTYEVVATVDGLDVVNSSEGGLLNNGYVLGPYRNLVIEGFRKNKNEIVTFNFGSKADSNIKNTGVIGSAIFDIYDPSLKLPALNMLIKEELQAFPADNRNLRTPAKK